MPKVSIIIPAYNAECHIEKCLKSIFAQTFTDYEVIVIDDGSTDKTYNIVKKIAEKDERIQLVKNVGKGVSSARNTGISKAKGCYITFVDSDDEISPVFLETLHSLISFNGSECAGIALTVNRESLDSKSCIEKVYHFEEDNVFKMLTETFCPSGGYVCNKIYLNAVIKEYNIFFDEEILAGEDLLFNFYYFKRIKHTAFCDKKLYYYKLSDSSSINKLDNDRWFDILTVYDLIISGNLNKDVKNIFFYNYALLILEALYRVSFCTKSKYTYESLNILKKKYVRLSVDYTLKQNLKLLIFKYFPNITMKYKRRFIKE